jgi:hypothetical protein
MRMNDSNISRRRFLKTTVLTGLLSAAPSVRAAVANKGGIKTIEFGSGRQLFIDDYLVASMHALKRTLHQPTDIESNPVMTQEHPWEHRRIPFGSVIYSAEEKKFRCWYLTLNIYDSRPGFRGYRKDHHVPLHEAAFLCYAESQDGVHWLKPELGLHEYRGSKKNNILLTCPGSHFDSTSVMHTPHDTEKPWKMISFIGRWPYREDLIKKQWGENFQFGVKHAAHYAWSSKDGIYWKPMNNSQPVLRASDRSMFWWDSEKKIYVAASKSSYQKKRAQRYAWSRDAVNWTITPTWIHRTDERDHPGDQGEAAYGFKYGGQYVGFCEMRQPRKGKPTLINWQLMTSRDGRNWTRPIREMFSPDGPKESWRHQVHKIFANPPIEQDGELLIYYGGKSGMVSVEKGDEPFQALCLARLRLDGFVSLDAGDSEGTVTTKPFKLPAGTLHMNVDATQGEILATMLDSDGQPIIQSKAIHGDRLKSAVAFNKSVSPGRIVSLKFTLRHCKLYSIWFEE